MSLHTLALIVLLAALGVGAFVFFGRERRGASPAVAPTAPADVEHDAETELATAQAPDDEATLAQREATAPTAAPTKHRRAPAAEDANEANDDTLVLEVTDGVTNAPAADVEVRYTTSERGLDRGCLARSFPISATRTRTDAQGLARLAVPHATPVAVLALSKGLLGEALFGARPADAPGEHRERLVLLHDWDLEVEVVDDAQRPVERVPVRLAPIRSGIGPGLLLSTRSDGRVLFRQVGHELSRNPERPLRVSVALALGDEVSAAIEREPPRGEPVRLRVAASGSVEVEVLASDGSPAKDDARVTLRLNEPGGQELSPFSQSQPPRSTSAQLRGGRARFEHVALGGEFTLSAESGPERGRAVVRGPRVADEVVHTTLRLAVVDSVLRFRALDSEGRPVVGRLEANVRSGGARTSGSTGVLASADDEGYFEIELEPELPPGDRRELALSAAEGTLAARVDLSRSFPPGLVEMGDVVLAAATIVAAGRVVNAAGESVAGAWIVCLGGTEEPNAGGLELDVHGVGTDEQGAFTLRGFTSARHVRLMATLRGAQSEGLEVAVGARDVELVLHGEGTVAGRVLLDPEVPQVDFWLKGADASQSGHWETIRRKDGSFELRGNPPGSYTLTVASGGETLAEVEGIAVVAGETTRDPRIQALDLRGRLHVFRIELVPPTKGFRVIGSISCVASGSAGPEHPRWISPDRDRTAEVELVTPFAHVDATVRIDGCRIERLTDLAPRTVVQLRAGFPVRLVLPAGVTLPGPPLFVGVALSAEGATFWSQPSFFDEHGEALCLASEPGRVQVHWFLERRGRGGGGRGSLEIVGQFAVVADTPDEQRIELALTSDELAAALRAR